VTRSFSGRSLSTPQRLVVALAGVACAGLTIVLSVATNDPVYLTAGIVVIVVAFLRALRGTES